MSKDRNSDNGRFSKTDKDLSNKRFSSLVALNKSRRKIGNEKYERWIWNCLCDCGKTVSVIETALMNGRMQSCGCKQGNSSHKEFGESSSNGHFAHYKKSAKDREINFCLSKEQFDSIVKDNCFYCDAKPIKKTFNKHSHGYTLANGIDRVDNNIGYFIDNCVACCINCNKAKSILTQQTFFELISKIYNKHCVKDAVN